MSEKNPFDSIKKMMNYKTKRNGIFNYSKYSYRREK